MTISVFWLGVLVGGALVLAALVPILFVFLFLRDWRRGGIW